MGTGARVGYLVPRFPGLGHGPLWAEIRALEARGVQVVVFSTQAPPPEEMVHDWSQAAMARTEYLASRAVGDAVRALPALPLRELVGAERGLVRDIAAAAPAAAQLVRSARAQGVGHVHVHACGRGALIAAIAARMGGPDYSLTLHRPLSEDGPGQNFKWRGARFVRVVTEKLRNEVKFVLRDDVPARLLVQPTGVETDRLRREDQYLPARPGQPLRLLSSGRLAEGKGFMELLAAVQRLRARGHAASLTIIGPDGGQREEIAARTRALGLEGHVTLTGPLGEAGVHAQLLAAHVFVLAAWAEPLGVTLIEAMSCGVPVIGTAAGGLRELITDGRDGLLVPPKDAGAIAHAVERLVDQPELARALSFQGRARAVSGYDIGRGTEALMAELGLRPRAAADDDLPHWPGA